MILRRLTEKDTDYMLEWMQDADIRKNFRNIGENKTREDALQFIQAADIKAEQGKSIHYAIANEEDEYLGTVSLKNLDLVSLNGEYAICLRKKAWGKGVAKWATEKLLQLAFDELGLERVYLYVLSDNQRAIHLYEKCGFLYEGEFRKHIYLRGIFQTLKWYGLLKEEYKMRALERVGTTPKFIM